MGHRRARGVGQGGPSDDPAARGTASAPGRVRSSIVIERRTVPAEMGRAGMAKPTEADWSHSTVSGSTTSIF
jgi:hypothetical protein